MSEGMQINVERDVFVDLYKRSLGEAMLLGMRVADAGYDGQLQDEGNQGVVIQIERLYAAVAKLADELHIGPQLQRVSVPLYEEVCELEQDKGVNR